MDQLETISKAKIKWIRSLRQKKQRETEGVFIVEGEKMVLEGLDCFAQNLVFLVSTKEAEMLIPSSFLDKSVVASAKDFEQISAFKQPNKLIAVFNLPTATSILPIRSIVLDGVQDPGNMGTILRLADWYGISQLICSEDTVDCFNEKVVQASMGAIYRVQVKYTDLEQFLSTTEQHKYGALLNGDNYKKTTYTNDCLLVMGNEGKGIRPEIEALIDKRVTIPKYGNAESLNVSTATAILLAQIIE